MGAKIVVGGVGAHPEVLRFDRGITPFEVFGGGQRQGGVEHGVQDIDERDFDDGSAEQLGAEVEHRPHQQAAGAATAGDKLRGLGVAGAGEILGASDEVGERGLLVLHAASFAPRFAELAAAANVGDGENDAPVQQTEARERKTRRHAAPVAAVAVKVERLRAGDATICAVDEGHGDFHAVIGGDPNALALVVGRIVAAEDFSLFHKRARAGRQVVVKDRRSGDERLVAEAHGRGVGFEIRREARGEDGFGKDNTVRGAGAQVDHAELRQTVFALGHDGVIAEEFDIGNLDGGVVGQKFRPIRLPGSGDGRGGDAVVLGGPVGDKIEQSGAVIDAVVVVGGARDEHAPIAERRVGEQGPDFSRGLARGRAKNKTAVQRATDADAEEFVLLVVEPRLLPGRKRPTAEVEATF